MPDLKKDAIVAFSLANLLLIASWRDLLYPASFDYHIQTGANRIDYASVMIAVLIVAAAIFAFLRVLSIPKNRFAEAVRGLTVLSLLIVALNIVRLQFLEITPFLLTLVGFPLLAASLIFFIATRFRTKVLAGAQTAVMILAPFGIVTFGQSVLGIIRGTQRDAVAVSVTDQRTAVKPDPNRRIKTRVVWIVFDEFDYRVPFELKPIPLPEFDKLASESLESTNALPPAADTLESVPSLIIGKRVEKARPSGAAELAIRFEDQSQTMFSKSENVFTDVQEFGGRSAALGWYHPYCRVFRDALSVCSWDGEDFSNHRTVTGALEEHAMRFTENLQLVPDADRLRMTEGFAKVSAFEFHESEDERTKVETRYRRRLDESRQLAADPNIDLLFIHLPIPHAPVQYDRTTRTFTTDRRDYVNNLALIDEFLGEVRRAMEAAGLWETSALIVSTDHSWRIDRWKTAQNWHKLALTDGDQALTGGVEDKRIPFFVKPPGRNRQLRYDRPINTVITRELIRGFLTGEIASTDSVARKLDEKNQ